MKIPFYNVERFYQNHESEIQAVMKEVFQSGKVLEGEAVTLVEKKLADICQRKYAIMVGSCTDALYFSLLTAGIKKDDEVIVPAYSFIASASPILRVGATPVFADTDIYGNIDKGKAQPLVSQKTKAIIPVHLNGRMVDPTAIYSFADKNNLIIIEDAAQAIGSSFNLIPAGNTGLCSCFSFDPSKVVSAFGTGGAVLTDDENNYHQIQSLRSQGKDSKSGMYTVQGFNSRISTFQAALLLFQLNNLPDTIARRSAIAEKYLKNIEFSSQLNSLPLQKENEIINHHKFPVYSSRRDQLKSFLKEKGIETGIHYPNLLPEQPVFQIKDKKFPVASGLSKTTLSLPIYPEISDDEISYLCESINSFFKN